MSSSAAATTSANNGCSTSNGGAGQSLSGRVLKSYLARSQFYSTPPLKDENEQEDDPTELNTINSSGGFLVVSPDKLTVKYTHVNLHGHDVGVIQANKPAPVHRLVYYFEIFVKDAGEKGCIAIGFTKENFKMRRQPGWEANSCGYHGDDGLLYRGQGKGEAFGPTFTTADTVGGGINYATQNFFFTKNGAVVGTVPKDILDPLYPTVAVHSKNEEVHVNFGQKDFMFDVKDYEAQERSNLQKLIENISLPPNVSHGLVRSYLLQYGYEETLNSFDSAVKSSIPPIFIPQESGSNQRHIEYALSRRKTLRELIRKGDIDDTISKLNEWYPAILQDENNSPISLLLQCQKFIELIRAGALMEAVTHGRTELQKFFWCSSYQRLLQDCAALLAYENPEESSVGYLLAEAQREVVADAVNAMVLVSNPDASDKDDADLYVRTSLEMLLRQLSACSRERKVLLGDQGESFDLRRVLSTCKKARC